ncbi:hypothetical protein [Halomonas sp. 707D7]|uniref:hypothetical protein n=1 Tax=unclassified Halomonas TaxID=2609666 RepID=UPI00345F3379
MTVSSTALLLIDVQASFPAREYWVEALAEQWRPQQRALLEAAKAQGIPLVRIFHEAPGSDTPFDPAQGLIRPLAGFEDSADVTFHKRVHNAFKRGSTLATSPGWSSAAFAPSSAARPPPGSARIWATRSISQATRP